MKYIAIDPSFSKTGVAILNQDTKTFIFTPIMPPGTNKTFKDMIERSALVATGVLKELDIYDEITLVLEEPMLTSLKASSLGLLSGVVTTVFLLLPGVKEIYTLNPNTMTRLNSAVPNKDRIHKKQISSKVASEIIEYLTSLGYTFEIKPTSFNKNGTPRTRKLSHDEAEAFIMLIVLLLNHGVIDYENAIGIYKINQGFYTKDIKVNKLK